MNRFAWVSFPALLTLACVGCGGPREASSSSAPGPSISIVEHEGVHAIAVRDLPANLLTLLETETPSRDRWEALFPIRAIDTGAAPAEDQPKVLGTYRVHDGLAVFDPRFPLSTKVSYHVEFRPTEIGSDLRPLRAVLHLSAPDPAPAARVAHVYPSANVLPANLLKFYIDFDRPMSRGVGHSYIQLLRADGSVVKDPFPEIGVELWDRKQQRFTVLLDPGRIKRGIRIHEEMGLPLVPGSAYRLVVDASWPDADGNPLAEDYVKSFEVVEADHTSPEPKAWSLDAPRAGSRDPVALRFPAPLDAAILERLIWLVDPDSREVAGRVTLEEDERRWLLHPEEAWEAGTYSLRIHPRLEDLAGNQIRRPFERDLSEDPAPESDAEVAIPVVIQ